MRRATEDSVKGGLIILAFTIAGAVLLGVVGFIAMGFVGERLWVPPADPNLSIAEGIDGPTWGGLSIAEWIGDLFVRPRAEPGKPDFGKMIHIATWRLGGAIGSLALGGVMGAGLALRYLSRRQPTENK